VAKAKLAQLKAQRWDPSNPHKTQTSPFFRRERLEKDDAMLARVVGAAMLTRDQMRAYPWEEREIVGRISGDRSCSWCDYNLLCPTELFGGNAKAVRQGGFRVGDPMDYYHDKKELSASD
jgi:hypothetical protein